ncbi:hypothetical protein AOQ84DRAFT_224394 [Glonium stellatum]|uniref:Uncharacterized protein n=1 Tax=Glonium stellatum TaxID=574774 RepID=A0A8E2EVW5_9PEZI|nr:hypothetical protein AOQ84DRAFT_224394 [Glonium stellatum]
MSLATYAVRRLAMLLPPSQYLYRVNLQDIAMVLPFRFCIDEMVTAGYNLLKKVGLINPERPRWTGKFSSLLSPRALESILESESVTEAMVLKLLRAKTLALQPYERPGVACKLLRSAINKFWIELTRLLIGAGAPVEQGVSPAAGVLRYMAQLWNEESAHSTNIGDSFKAVSPALYETIDTMVPNLETLRILLNAGVSSESENDKGPIAIFAAAYVNKTTKSPGPLFGFDANPDNSGKEGYPSVLRTLRDTSCEKFVFFLNHGADLNGPRNHGNSVIAANILYHFEEERFAEAISTADFTGKAALHLPAASENTSTFEMLIDPQQVLRPELNLWRALTIEREDHRIEKNSENSEIATEKRMTQKELRYAESIRAVPPFLRKPYAYISKPEEVMLTIRDAQ